MKITIDDLKRSLARNKKEKPDKQTLETKYREIDAYLAKEGVKPPNKDIATATMKYLTETHEDIDCREKGLFFIGNPGTGKTVASSLIASYRDYEFYAAFELQEMYLSDQREYMTDLMKSYESMVIDDIGAEVTMNDYGMKFELLEFIINWRHKAYQRSGALTVFTSNLTGEQFKARYGGRIYSRIREMCECVVCNGDDLRLK